VSAGRASLAALVVGIACASGAAGGVRAALGEEFSLRIGEGARVGSEGVEVVLDEVVADSRCAAGVQCVWEGDAVVRVGLRVGLDEPQVLELHTAARERRAATLRGYRVRLVGLEPRPIAGRATRAEDYRATLEVSRAPEGSAPGEWQR